MRLPAYFLCHGGGPWPWMQGPLRHMLHKLEQSLLAIPGQLPQRPHAVLVISSHWEADAFSVTSSPAPGMVYDYAGFPEETYQIRYASPGSPDLARQVVTRLSAAGLASRESPTEGYDHSTYSLMQPMFPAADIPVVQMSMRSSLDAGEHLRAGQALAPLRDEGVLIIGSGMSCHERGPDMGVASPAFDEWLHQALIDQEPAARWQALQHWTRAPFARVVHPREDHLLPLMVAAGAAMDEPAHCVYRDRLLGRIAVSSFRFGT